MKSRMFRIIRFLPFVWTIGVVMLDLLYRFGNSDIPLIAVFISLCVFAIVGRNVRIWVATGLFVLIGMTALAFSRFGITRITERTAQWMFIWILSSLAAYALELRRQK